MRLPCTLLSAALFFTAAACRDPKCQPGELRVGTTCRPTPNLPDSSAGTPNGSERFDASAGEEDELDGDDEAAGDSATPRSPDGGAGAPSTDPGAVLDTLPGGPPIFQFRADNVTLNGNSVASIPNLRGTDALVVSKGALAAPVSDAAFGGAESIAFSGSQWLDSNLPAARWKSLHDGTGVEVFHVFASTALAGISVISSTLAAQPGHQIYVNEDGSWAAQADNDKMNVGSLKSPPSSLALNTPTYVDWAYGEALPVEFQLFTRDVPSGKGDTTFLTSNSEAARFRLGAQTPQGGFPAHMRWCETLIFPRVLHEYERQLVREYIQARYGIAAPKLVGADREVMSLLPFSWIDASLYKDAGGKVFAFIDRAQPGHIFGQPTPEHQVDAPSSDVGLNGELSAPFTGNQWYDSTYPATGWNAAVNGTGWTAYHALVPTSLMAARVVFAIGAGAISTPGTDLFITRAGAPQADVYQAGTSVAQVHLPEGTAVAGAPLRLSVELSTSELSIRAFESPVKEAPKSLGVAAVATARLGAYADGSFPGHHRWATSLMFNRLLNDDERSRVEAALSTKYGLPQ